MRKYIMLLLSLIILSSCTEEEVTARKYPRVSTDEVTDLTISSMVFHGNLYFSSVEIMDHGFVWTGTGFPTITNGNKISMGATNKLGSFESTASGTLIDGKTYLARAYVQSADYIVYGELLEFESP